jgi:hypothetical protein
MARVQPRSRLVLEEDMANMAAQLYSSDYFKPVEGRGVVDFEGNKMEANAHLLLEVRCVDASPRVRPV